MQAALYITFLCSAACLLFSCEKLVKMYLSSLSKRCSILGDYKPVAEILVALTVTTERLNNSLEQGVEKILRFAFGQRRSGQSNKPLMRIYISELKRRLVIGEVSTSTISQLGIYATSDIIQIEGWDDEDSSVEMEDQDEEE